MFGRGWRVAAATAAALGVVASGCSRTVDGVGQYASGLSDVPDAKVAIHGTDGSEVDRLAGNAIADIQAFWTEQMPLVFGKPYKPVSGFYSVDPNGDRPAPCTTSPADIRGNAFYCPTRDIVAWDRVGLLPELQRKFGKFLVAMVLAHEWGHAIQHRTSMPSSRTIVIEAQADCYAGSWTKTALTGGAPHFQIDRGSLDQALAGYLLFRDPIGASANSRQAHGSGFDRISAFQEGYDQGPKHCSTFDDNRVFTEIPFSSDKDLANQGNLPYDEALDLGPKDIADYWDKTFTKAFHKTWTPVKRLDGFDGSASRPSCAGSPVSSVQYCTADDTIYFDRAAALRKVYDQTGDFGPMTLIAVAYGQAVRKRLGQSVNGNQELLDEICLAGAYANDVFNGGRSGGISLSPGDLDEAIQALLNFAGQSGFFEARGTVGFDRIAAFRRGFGNITSCA